MAGQKKKKRAAGAPVEAAEADADSSAGTPLPDGAAADSSASASADAASAGGDAAGAKPTPATAAAPARDRTHLVRGGLIFATGTVSTFLFMANDAHVAHGPLYGMLAMVVATVGLLDLLGLLVAKDPSAVAAAPGLFGKKPGEPAFLAPKYTAPLAAAVLLVGGLVGGYPALPWVVLGTCAVLLPAAIRRPALLVAVITTAIYLPLLGTYSLWDPWETHYGEVAREMLSRDDWISLWWAQENWFWSKPILIFWTEALSMGALGVEYLPDANPTSPEWALRLPHFLMGLGAVLAAYAAVSKVFGRRAGVLSALVLATMPQFFMIVHQAITDIPFVANMTIAMCLLVLALAEDPERHVRTYKIGPLTVSARHAVLAAVFLCVMPQVLYLASRNVSFVDGYQFAWHHDQFLWGSAGNGSVPGNTPVRDEHAYLDGIAAQPFAQALLWLAGLAGVIFLLRNERRARSLYMVAFYLFAGIAFLGKGIPGFALPGMIALFVLVASRKWSLLFEGHLRIAVGALVVAIVGLPWYVAMFVRHGPPFIDRLIVHDHINRLASGVHGDTGSVQYFLEQLGPGMFPWVALVPAAILLFAWRKDDPVPAPPAGADVGPYRTGGPGEVPAHVSPETKRQTLLILGLWFAASFVLFSAMITKFHHYVFPALPAAALLTGILLDRLFGPRFGLGDIKGLAVHGLVLASVVLAVAGFGGIWGDLRGLIPEESVEDVMVRARWVLDHGPSAATCAICLIGALAAFAAALYVQRKRTPEEPAPEGHETSAPLVAVLLAGAVILAFVGRDLSWVTDARPQGYERLLQLYVYNYGRPWPEHLDYRPIFTGFAIAATLVTVLAAFRALRPTASRAMLAVALVFTTWVINVYMIDLSPHWGQRELFVRYYEDRSGPDDPIVAWQMNWKGENFYTGNRVAAFVDLDNAKLREWITQNRGKKAYFILEHGRLGSLRGMLPGREVEELSTRRENNKFVLVSAQL